MPAAGIGEDIFALGKTMQGFDQALIYLDVLLQRGIMHILQEIIGVYGIFHLQTAQRGAVGMKEAFAQLGNDLGVKAHHILQIAIHAFAKDRPQPIGGGVNGLVQVDQHGGDRFVLG